MGKVELTPAELAIIRQKAEAAENCSPSPWVFREMPAVKGEVRDSENFQVAGWFTLRWQAEHIAAADPATVLALLDELTDVRMALLELAWEFYGRDQTREEIESCCAVMVENERASRKESEAGQ